MTKVSFAVFSLLACLAAPVSADDDDGWDPPGKWSLMERQQWQKLRGEALGYLKDAHDHCKTTSFQLDFDYESFRGKFKDNESYGLDAYGRGHLVAAISAVDNICKIGEREQKAVAKGIKLIKIAHGKKGGKASSSITYANRTLLPVIEPAGPQNAGGFQDELERWIKKQL